MAGIYLSDAFGKAGCEWVWPWHGILTAFSALGTFLKPVILLLPGMFPFGVNTALAF